MKNRFLLLGVCAVCVVLPWAFVYLGVPNVAASNPEIAAVEWLLSTTMKRSVGARARGIDAPDLADEGRIREGLSQYAGMCVVCHGAPGIKPSGFIRGLNPPAPILADEVDEWEDAELFWITKHGVKMTGMPAFGHAHTDDEIWAMVAFLRQMPTMSPDEYARELMEAGPHVHATQGEAHDTDDDHDAVHDDQDNSATESHGDHEHGDDEEHDEEDAAEEGHEEHDHSH